MSEAIIPEVKTKLNYTNPSGALSNSAQDEGESSSQEPLETPATGEEKKWATGNAKAKHKASTPASSISGDDDEKSNVIHHGFVCDGPNCPQKGKMEYIQGVRFHCDQCFNVDFCSNCVLDPANGHSGHSFSNFEKCVVRKTVPSTTSISTEMVPHRPPSSDGGRSTSPSANFQQIKEAMEAVEAINMLTRMFALGGDSSASAQRETRNLTEHEQKIQALGGMCSPAERKLLDRVYDQTNVPKGYTHVHFDDAVIRSLERVTHLGLTRRQQFQFGILQNNQVTGAVLYGPPGTGKTLLAQAVAKQCGFSMLGITSGDIFQKEWGEDEKVIRAAFSLGRKLHPCILFVDEADGIFSARQSDDKKHIRGMINEFLSEWDGASSPGDKSQNPLVLLATNRPFDIDVAILRRAPIRIFMDLPTPKQREGILRVLLREESLGADITVEEIAKLTRLYTGSDLKNLCVSAALISVGEQVPDPVTGEYPESRTLCRQHFDAALREVRATIPNKMLARQLLEFQKRGG